MDRHGTRCYITRTSIFDRLLSISSAYTLMTKRPNSHWPKSILSIAMLILTFSTLSQANPQKSTEFDALHRETSALAHMYYKEAARELKGTFYIKRSVSDLKKAVVKLAKNEQHALANAVILANFPLIKKHIDSREMPIFLAQLLNHNIWKSAQELANEALRNGRYRTQSKTNYLLAEYYFSHDNLKKSIEHLTAIESSKPLTQNERDYATLIFGISLQRKKQHRKALKIYEKIESTSDYYGHSRLNMAIGYIRQGWWTDAEIAIADALLQKPPEELKEINNRLLLVLGYSQLQHEFYRNARKTFRKVGLDSRYMNRALHGIGLCAISQKDYPGAINAFKHLQSNEQEDVSSLESYLLVPYTQNRMGELDQAAAGYSEAVVFYEIKARELEASVSIREANPKLPLNDAELASLSDIAKKTHRMLHELDAQSSRVSTQKKIQTLKLKLNRALSAEWVRSTQEKADNLKSYLSQSQYGLAKLYDAP